MSERRLRTIRVDATSYFVALLLAFTSVGLSQPASAAEDVAAYSTWPGPGQLFVGTCYQPVDRSPDEIDQDIAIMKRAGFNVVRMGDLSWDSFEPSQRKFTFEWFNSVMDKMHAAGIRVILDIPGLPAPIWLHRAYAGVLFDRMGKIGFLPDESPTHFVARSARVRRALSRCWVVSYPGPQTAYTSDRYWASHGNFE